tara:strand:+ start:542 stop:940 length:399 start_codon:yes stop_codon:yes gene_type:complete
MIVTLDFKDISEKDLSPWKQGAGGLGKIGLLFYSEDISSINLETYEFILKIKDQVDLLILATPSDTFSEDSLKLWAYLPLVDFIYANSTYDNLFENIPIVKVFHAPNQKLSSSLLEQIEKLDTCEIVDYKDV